MPILMPAAATSARDTMLPAFDMEGVDMLMALQREQ